MRELHPRPWLPAARVLATLLCLLAGLLSAARAQITTPPPTTTQRIDAEARSKYVDGSFGKARDLRSNTVVATAAITPPSIEFFTDDSYRTRAWNARAGARLFVQLKASACNRNPDAIEQVGVNLHSWGSGSDWTNSFTATETAPNSGVFRIDLGVPTLDMSSRSGKAEGRDWLGAIPGNSVSASVEGCGGSRVDVIAQIQIDPDGQVFDSATGAPIAGVGVTLIDVTGAGNGGAAGAPARVFGYDGVTPAPNAVVTGADGAYAFPRVAPSEYRLLIKTPPTYSFPSRRAVADLPKEYVVIASGSFGGAFAVNQTTGAVTLDLPLDPIPHGLSVQKIASRSTAEIAETVEYSVTVKNVGELDLQAVRLSDSMPAGFAYVPGSARLDGAALADPGGGRGPQLTFAIGSMSAGSSRLLRYRTRLGAGALQSDGINRAQARSDLPATTISNLAAVQVKVDPGVFSDKAFVLGTVFADCNGNGLQDPGEPGAPGIRLYLEDGSFVVTDGSGRFSLYGVSPRTHVLKVDASSLPEGAELVPISQRHGGDGASRFVDPHRGELHRADFALRGCSPALLQTLKARRAALGESEMGTALKTDLKAGAPAPTTDVRALPAQGLVGETRLDGAARAPTDLLHPRFAAAAGTSASAPLVAPVMAAMAMAPTVEAAPTPPMPPKLEALAAEADDQLAFIDLHDGQTVSRLPQALRIKGRHGAVIALQVNGVALGDDRIGERAVAADSQAELREYVGVVLAPGDNTLRLTEADGFGHVRASREVHVVVPGPLARIVVTPARARADADGRSRTEVRIELQDARGLAIVERVPVTLDSTEGLWDVRDLDPRQPGVQTFIEGGVATLGLIAPPAPGDARLRVTAGAISGQGLVAFGPVLRPMMAVGVVEGALDLRRLDPKALVAAKSDDGFEEELRQYGNGDTSAGARAALFLKGKVRGDYLLTLGYDSDKPTHDGLFRDIQPDAFYPVYGDSSVRGFDAQSTGRLYVRVEKDKSYLLYGDFTTQAMNPARQLGAYQRSLNGLKEHFENERVTANAYASHDSTRQVIQELRADGTSGPFTLSGANLVDNSETVEILVRDRNQPSLIVKSTTLARFTDYDLDPLGGRLLLRAPVPSYDSDLNPMSIRVSFEIDQGGPAFWVAGVDAQAKVTEQVELGGSFVKDFNPQAPYQLASVNGSVKLSDTTQVTGEAARTEHDLAAPGNAERVEFLHDGVALKARIFAARSDLGFDNPSATLSSGRSEGGAKIGYALDERTRLTADALHTGDIRTGAHRDGVLLGIERSFDGGTKLELGARAVRNADGLATPTGSAATGTGATPPLPGQENGATTSLRAKLTTAVPGLPLASVFVEAEQDVRESDKRLLAVGGEYQLANQGRLYLRHELISSLTGPYALDSSQRRNTTVFGIDADYMDGGRLFSEYRGLDAFDGRGTEAAIGLRNRWTLADGLRANTSFERVQPISGARKDASAAVTGAIEYTASPLWKGTARLELRDGAETRGLLSTIGIARKLDADWTFLGKNIYALTQTRADAGSDPGPTTSTAALTQTTVPTPAVQPTGLQERLQLGVAYRDSVSNRVNALARYEFKQERGGLDDAGTRTAQIVSTHADYQACGQLTLTGHGAAKWVVESLDGQRVRSDALLLGGRALYDMRSGWDVGIAASVLATGRLSSRQSAVGAEVGYMVQTNLWLSVGYNLTGFKDRDLSPENYTNRGVYLRLRFKFDEDLFTRHPT
jgi:uncharacterized repeat protein (TIGR01451 family)